MTAFRLAAHKKAPQVDGKGLVPICEWGFLGSRVLVNTGVVESDVEGAEVIDHLCDHSFHTLRISHVSRDGKSLDLLLFKFMADLIGELGAHVDNRNFGARLSQGDRKRFANRKRSKIDLLILSE